MALKLISPIGSNPTEQTCENIIALVQDGRKYWLSLPEYVALGSPAWEEVSMDIFNSYPDGTNVIVVNGVTISVKDTNVLCGKTSDYTKYIIGIVILVILYFSFFRKG